MTLIAALFWPALLAVSIWLRRTAPYLLFGVMFFLVGHLLESTFVGLEMYFGHRNYVPAFGLYFGLVYGAAMVPARYRGIAAAGIGVYAILFAAVLFLVTSGWAEPRISAERWVTENPNSERAAQFLANQYLQEGNHQTAQRIIDEVAERQPRAPIIQIQRAQFCAASEAESAGRLELSVERLRDAYFEPVAATETAEVHAVGPRSALPGA